MQKSICITIVLLTISINVNAGVRERFKKQCGVPKQSQSSMAWKQTYAKQLNCYYAKLAKYQNSPEVKRAKQDKKRKMAEAKRRRAHERKMREIRRENKRVKEAYIHYMNARTKRLNKK